jgi:hypothetical protein
MSRIKQFGKQFAPHIILGMILSVFLLPFCGWVFGCGCSFLWSGGVSHCSIYDAARPDCPWCVAPAFLHGNKILTFLFQMIPFVFMYGSAVGIIYFVRRFYGSRFWRDLAIGMLVFLAAGILIAWVYGNLMDYPYPLFHSQHVH